MAQSSSQGKISQGLILNESFGWSVEKLAALCMRRNRSGQSILANS